jgi:hypothetical protein
MTRPWRGGLQSLDRIVAFPRRDQMSHFERACRGKATNRATQVTDSIGAGGGVDHGEKQRHMALAAGGDRRRRPRAIR